MKEVDFLNDWIDRLKQCGKPIIVEGKNDRKALRYFGISHIYTLDRPLFEICEEVSEQSKGVVIMLDLDKEGKKLYGKINSDLQQLGVQVDNSFREELFHHTKLRQIEGLDSYWKRISDRADLKEEADYLALPEELRKEIHEQTNLK